MTRDPESAPMAPGQAYDRGVAAGRWHDDPEQRRALAALDRVHHELLAAPRPGLLARFGLAAPPAPARGLYLWGGVGRGKTFLVDLFYEHLALDARRRVHFHRFMGEVHARLASLGEVADPLDRVAEVLAGDLRLLCLDEFFVIDIGDAMLLARLLEGLFRRGVCLVTTSNIAPQGLYRDGLQRARFVPAIALIETHCEVLELAAGTDYRLRALTQAPVYLTPPDADAEAALAAGFERLTRDCTPAGGTLEVNGRAIPVREWSEGVAWFDFAALCEGPRAVADYIEIARDFHSVLVSGVPQFEAGDDDAFRRFVHLVDELYDRNVNLLLSAAAGPTELYRGERLRLEAERLGSRLIEMQSEDYLARAHLS